MKLKRYHWAVVLMAFGCMLYMVSCTNGDNANETHSADAEPEVVTEVAAIDPTATHAADDTDYDSLFNPYPPHDVSSEDASYKELAIFAWREMIALMWQSSYVESGNKNTRAEPDLNWNYASDDLPFPSEPTVWETYAHRTEFRSAQGVPQRPFDSAPLYEFSETGTYAGGSGSNAIFNFLDEDSEISSCYLFSVESEDSLMVMYQAKVNRSEYDYIKNTFPTVDSLKIAKTTTQTNINTDKEYYPSTGAPDNCNCPPSVICLPCGQQGGSEEGAMEIKTAWRKAYPTDNLNHFFHRVVMYAKNGSSTPTLDTFLLVGMHIIHKTENMPEFVFATWEHESVDAGANNESYVYIPQGKDNDIGMHIDEEPGVPAPVKRLHPVDSLAYFTISNTVHDMITAKNPNHVLQYYRLVGVQGKPVNYPQRATVPSYFLANYVIESDARLQDFYGSFPKPQDSTQVNLLDVSEKSFITMGGCQGCHGVAQKNGTDFSFLIGPSPITEFDPYYVSFAKAVDAAKPKK